MSDVMSMTPHRTNSALVADVARLRYIGPLTLDLTFGHGNFWNDFRPRFLVANDLNPAKGDHHIDYTGTLPASWLGRFHTTVLDADYRLNGTPDRGELDERFGTDVAKRWQDRMHDICDGAYNAAKTVRPNGFLLVKVQDQVVSGRKVWQERCVVDTVARRCYLADRLHLPNTPPKQRSQTHSRSNYSTLLVFKRKDNFR